jgi:hypothetical protein
VRKLGRSMEMRVRRLAAFSEHVVGAPTQPWDPGKSVTGMERWTQLVI